MSFTSWEDHHIFHPRLGEYVTVKMTQNTGFFVFHEKSASSSRLVEDDDGLGT